MLYGRRIDGSALFFKLPVVRKAVFRYDKKKEAMFYVSYSHL